MKITPANFELMQQWFASVVPEVFPATVLHPEIDPTIQLERLAATSPSKARLGLRIAIGDIVEVADSWPAARVAEVDMLLIQEGLPSLSEVRTKFSKVLRRVITRGSIKNDAEYYAVRNAAEMANQDEQSLWELIASYESRQSS